MTTTHQLMAAAFYLCGLFFLYHIDCVNSVRCKFCDFANPDCNSGNVPDVECLPNQLCSVVRLFSPEVPSKTSRGCSEHKEGSSCTEHPDSEKRCVLICATDNCNSATNLGEE
ncbi:uncharacterized protein LOC112568359 [Pomacea canaliculata]|uniref:uncharacterized protein LOC112568359 n=1 Tax=Pomacea canaliculata TaxID=400727 RepID=UPI000D73477C|nr:uncharacterized protein LOC112568359 [Pomacea canaliculata]XP_025101425.1 uncharacterized protein LOC112568359 [Pomacea canaliculata]